MSESQVVDRAQWRVHVKREAFAADVDEYRRRYGKAEGERRFHAENAPVEVHEEEGNLLLNGGVSCLWECLIGNGTGTAAQTLAALDPLVSAPAPCGRGRPYRAGEESFP